MRTFLVQLPLDHAGGDPLYDEVLQLPDGGDGELGHEEAVGQHLVLLGEADHGEKPQLAAHGLGHLGQRVGALGQALVAPVREYVEQGEVLAVRPVSQLLDIFYCLIKGAQTMFEKNCTDSRIPECWPCPATLRTRRPWGPPAPA